MSTPSVPARPARTRWLAGGVTAGLLGAMLAGASLAPVAAQDPSAEPEHTLSVSGTGSVSVKPDVADVTVGVTIQRDTAGDAAADAANVMDAVITALKGLGIAEEDIQTTTLSLSPVYDYDNTPYRIVGYTASNLVTVTVRDLSQTGPVIDAATAAGATDVNSISFRLQDQTAAETEAREMAVLAARAKADTIASAAADPDHGHHQHRRDQRAGPDAGVLRRHGRGGGSRRERPHARPGRHHRRAGRRVHRLQHPVTS